MASSISRARDAVLGGDGIGQFVERALFCGQHHGLDIAQRDPFLLADIENQLLQFIRDHHHVAAERVDQFARAIGIDFHAPA